MPGPGVTVPTACSATASTTAHCTMWDHALGLGTPRCAAWSQRTTVSKRQEPCGLVTNHSNLASSAQRRPSALRRPLADACAPVHLSNWRARFERSTGERVTPGNASAPAADAEPPKCAVGSNDAPCLLARSLLRQLLQSRLRVSWWRHRGRALCDWIAKPLLIRAQAAAMAVIR